MLHFSVK